MALAACGSSRKTAAPRRNTRSDFDDSAWNTLEAKSDGGPTIKTENTTAIYRAHVKLTEDRFERFRARKFVSAGCDDEGWYFVNGQFVGESHDWAAQPVFDIKKFLHAGDNVIAVGVKNDGGDGGLNPNVNVDIIGTPSPMPWSRSLFNGLAEIIVQSTTGCRRNQTDRQRRWIDPGDSSRANAAVRATPILAGSAER